LLMYLFNQTAVQVCEGQQMDMDFESRENVTIVEYIEMIRLKTSVLLGCALEMGAIIADASSNNRSNMYAFGQDLGLAFQIKDDILDLYGDPEKFGKQIGGDVIANKKTLLYLLAIQNANADQKEIFKQLESEIDLDFKVKAVRKMFDELNIQNMAKGYMQKYYDQAMTALENIDVSPEKKTDLIELADYLMNREH
jgi:geranylgeranyl diphosphate synthase type II